MNIEVSLTQTTLNNKVYYELGSRDMKAIKDHLHLRLTENNRLKYCLNCHIVVTKHSSQYHATHRTYTQSQILGT